MNLQCTSRRAASLGILAAALLSGSHSLIAGPPTPNGLAATPPMGWNSWNKFACNVSEDLIKRAAAALVKTGMKDAGYEFIVIDDCWQISRDAAGNIVPRPARAVPAAAAMSSRTPGNTPPGASIT